MTFKEVFKKFWWAFAAAALVFVLVVVISIINAIEGTRNEGERREQDLTALYNTSVISLSACIDQGRTAAQVTEEEFKVIKEILVETAAARYTNESEAAEAIGGGRLFSMVSEAYPQIDQRSWQNLQTVVVGCRKEFEGSQKRIQSTAAEYNRWRVSNDVFNGWIKDEFPSNELKVVKSDGETVYAMAAYDHITTPVTADEALKAFETGVLTEQDLFGDDE